MEFIQSEVRRKLGVEVSHGACVSHLDLLPCLTKFVPLGPHWPPAGKMGGAVAKAELKPLSS